MSALSDEAPQELVTLRASMSAGTFNRLLTLVQAEYPDAEPVPADGVVHIMSRQPLTGDSAT